MKEEKEAEVIKDKQEKKDEIIGSTLAYIFVIWYILSMLAMTYFSKVNKSITSILFGQCFFVFAMTIFAGKDKNLVPLIHLTVGIIAIIAPFVIKILPRFSDLTKSDYINYATPIASIILGYYFIIASRAKTDSREFNAFYIFSWIFYLIGIIKIILFCI